MSSREDLQVKGEKIAGAFTYAAAGVDIDRASLALERVRQKVQATFPGTGAAGEIGHFGGFFRLSDDGDRYLVASADGIGTKLKLAFVLGGKAHARVGADLVNHCVNDLLACGAKPLFFLDYIATGTLEPDAFASLVSGMADACLANGVAMIGGETAEMPGLYADGEYDVAGFIVGDVRESEMVDGSRIELDDVLIGIPSGGMQTNGYSLARAILGLTGVRSRDLEILGQPVVGGDGETLGEALMAPHRSFLTDVLPLSRSGRITGMAHITGGGLVANVPRMLPAGMAAHFDRESWQAPPLFSQLVQMGDVHPSEYHRVLNMGIGFVLAARSADADSILTDVPESVVIGSVEAIGSGGQRVLGLD